jgi:hypothetical protein
VSVVHSPPPPLPLIFRASEDVAGATYDDDEKLETSQSYEESNGLLKYIISSYKQDGDCRDRTNNCKEKQLYKLMRKSYSKACR